MTKTMKAVRFHPPGGPEKLKYADEPVPSSPGEGEVLVRVSAAGRISVHRPSNCSWRLGLIWPELYWPIYRDQSGHWKSHIPAHDFSGTITALGPGCDGHGLEVGSEVCVFTSRRNHGLC
jgi:NADPH:quinone reductase-like Zn-dependent oxidoreductase